jgi:hypothetical protein
LEGKGVGRGDFTFILKIDGNVVCERAVDLDLQPIEGFYDIYQVGTVSGSGDKWEVQVGTNAVQVQTNTAYSTESDKYLLYVHDWNMSPQSKRRYGETIFQSLSSQNYKGG